ncbi:MAG: T9SS type A sorting domain-containing protein, partial [Phaeodactylibacter sp.]|nr:T9SS type A sorting domain-containing protein [Phaeodactylibacter sp.]
LRFGVDASGEFYILTKADGKIRTLKTPGSTSLKTPAPETVNWLSPNPGNGLFELLVPQNLEQETTIQVVNELGQVVWQQAYHRCPAQLDLRQLPAGNYWVSWQSAGRQFVQQVQKQ